MRAAGGAGPAPAGRRPRQEPTGDLATRARGGWEAAPGARGAARVPAAWNRPGPVRGLEQVLALPVAVTGEDMAKVSKTLWMRYTLQLVRATGENIRNLDVLGLYRIPGQGTRANSTMTPPPAG